MPDGLGQCKMFCVEKKMVVPFLSSILYFICLYYRMPRVKQDNENKCEKKAKKTFSLLFLFKNTNDVYKL